MDGIEILTAEQVAERKKEHKRKRRLLRKERGKESKKRRKEKKRRRERSNSTSSSASSSSSSSSSSASSRPSKRQTVAEQRSVQERHEDSRKRREEAGLGWMLAAGPSSSPAAASRGDEQPTRRDFAADKTAFEAEMLAFDASTKIKPQTQTPEQAERDILSLKNIPKHLIVALGEATLLVAPPQSFLHEQDDFMCKEAWIVPLDFAQSVRDASGDALVEFDRFKMAVAKTFASQNLVTVFMEHAVGGFRQRTRLECVGLEPEVAESLHIVFEKEISELGDEFEADHRAVIDLKSKTLRQGLPPHSPYFFVEMYDVDLSLGPIIRCAHMIGSNERFERDFGWKVIRGSVGRSSKRPRRRAADVHPELNRVEEERLRTLEFVRSFKPFDWTVELDGGEHVA